MSPKRLFFVMIGSVLLVFVLMLAGTYKINGLLASQADKLTQQKAKSQALSLEQSSLVKAKQEVAQYSDLQKITQSIVPEDKDQAEAVREIVNIAAANGISLSSVNFPASTLGGASSDSPAPSSSASSSSSSSTPVGGVGASGASSSAANGPDAGKLSQLQPVTNIPGVYVLQLTVESDSDHPVSYTSFIGFLSDLEHNRRTAQISSISLQPTTENPDLLTFTLVLNEYIKP